MPLSDLGSGDLEISPTDNFLNKNASTVRKLDEPPPDLFGPAIKEPSQKKTFEEQPELTWGETAQQAASSLIPSIGKQFSGIYEAITSPIETAKSIGQLGKGAVSKAKGALGFEQDEAQKAQDEALINALGEHYAQTYGSMKGFKKALAEDPASVAMDLSAIGTGGGTAAAKALGTTSAVGKAAEKIASASRLLNPVDDAVRLAGTIVKIPVAIARTSAATTSGMPASLQKVATQAGATADPKLREAFVSFARGEGKAEDIFDKTQNALEALKKEASNEFVKNKAAQAQLAKTPNYQPIDDAIAEARKANSFAGRRDPRAFRERNDMLDDIEGIVSRHKADPNAQNFVELDKLKRAIWDIGKRSHDVGGDSPATMVFHGVKKSLNDISPEYQKLMDFWSDHLDHVRDLTQTLGQGNKSTATSALVKTLRASKTERGMNLISQLAEKEPEIPYMLAGYAASPWFTHGIGPELSRLGGIGTILSQGAAYIPHAGAVISASSPRVIGMTNYYAGMAGKPFEIPGRIIRKATKSPTAPALSVLGNLQDFPSSEPTGISSTGTSTTETSDIDRRRIMAESSGRQFDKYGNPLTSPKGAVGAAQVMPGTGPEAAKLAGLPWDPERLAYDKNYNMALGQAYYDKQLKTFGNQAAALAAYNAGPGATKEAIQKASLRGGSFLDYLPNETQDYVRKIMGVNLGAATGGRIQRASGGRAGINHGARADQLIAAVERSKKQQSNITEPLLDAHDDAVVKALAVAQKAI